MATYMTLRGCDLRVQAHNVRPMIQAVRTTLAKHVGFPHASSPITSRPEHLDLHRDWRLFYDPDGNIIDLDHVGDSWYSFYETMFRAMCPFVEPGGYVEIFIGDGSGTHFRYYFEGDRMDRIDAERVFKWSETLRGLRQAHLHPTAQQALASCFEAREANKAGQHEVCLTCPNQLSCLTQSK